MKYVPIKKKKCKKHLYSYPTPVRTVKGHEDVATGLQEATSHKGVRTTDPSNNGGQELYCAGCTCRTSERGLGDQLPLHKQIHWAPAAIQTSGARRGRAQGPGPRRKEWEIRQGNRLREQEVDVSRAGSEARGVSPRGPGTETWSLGWALKEGSILTGGPGGRSKALAAGKGQVF